MPESGLVTPHKRRLVELPSNSTHIPPLDSVQVAQEPLKDSQTPLMIRRETEQLIGHQLIKDLSNFKQNTVALCLTPLSIHHSKRMQLL
jgi:hypothetical protein